MNRQFSDALVEYRLAIKQRSSGRLRAKAGAAALHVADYAEAVSQYAALAKESQDRRAEAADGLERVARASIATNDRAGLALALAALRPIATGRALASFAGPLARGISEGGSAAEAMTVLPAAAAGALDVRWQDSLMLQYGRALSRGGRCAEGSAIFEALIRRQRDPGVARAAQNGLVQCVLQLGRQSVDEGQPQHAEEWFRKAITEAGDSPLARPAYLGLGDVMLARGDYAGAADAYFRAMQGAPPGDSTAERAREKLGTLSNAGTVVR